ncbi:MAG: SDR family NAD(P)-dependent oxidoreductase, partial [Nitrospirota bacterium]
MILFQNPLFRSSDEIFDQTTARSITTSKTRPSGSDNRSCGHFASQSLVTQRFHISLKRGFEKSHTIRPVVIVTGASRGLGRTIALAFGKRKYRIVVNYHLSDKDAQEVVSKIISSGG